jgi:RES domain-containing protein
MSDVAAGRVPASWALQRRLADEGTAGILVPSYASGATTDRANLVLWEWSDRPPHQVVVFDPNQRLPRNRASWS